RGEPPARRLAPPPGRPGPPEPQAAGEARRRARSRREPPWRTRALPAFVASGDDVPRRPLLRGRALRKDERPVADEDAPGLQDEERVRPLRGPLAGLDVERVRNALSAFGSSGASR